MTAVSTSDAADMIVTGYSPAAAGCDSAIDAMVVGAGAVEATRCASILSQYATMAGSGRSEFSSAALGKTGPGAPVSIMFGLLSKYAAMAGC